MKVLKSKNLIAAIFVIGALSFSLSGCGTLGLESTETSGGEEQNAGQNVYKTAGTYEVGVDIEEGEYLLVAMNGILSTGGYYEVTKTKNASISSSDFLYNGTLKGSRRYVKVYRGEFLKFNDSDLYRLENAPAAERQEDLGYKPGQYKAGRDLPKGEYIVVDTGNASNYLEVTTLPNASVVSAHFLFNEAFVYRHYVRLEENQYVTFNAGEIYPADSAPAVRTESGSYPAGQYKVGKDLPAGRYVVDVQEGTTVYYELTTLPLCAIGSSAFLRNGNLRESGTFDLAEGQYIRINGGSLSPMSDL